MLDFTLCVRSNLPSPVYIGSTLHEVAHVAAAGQAISEAVSKNAVIVKMIRVIMLVPLLLTLSAIAPQPSQPTTDSETSQVSAKKSKILIPQEKTRTK